MIAALAQTAVGAIVDKFKEAEERAKELAKILRDEVAQGFSALKEKITGGKEAVAEADKSIDSLVKTAQGKIDGEVKMKVAELHMETL